MRIRRIHRSHRRRPFREARSLSCMLFFFQAEDGIRDLTVTGVQTCALPILITVDGKYFRQRLEQLAQSPAKLLEAETERDRVLEESRRASARAGELRAQVEARDRASEELGGAPPRGSAPARRMSARPTGLRPGQLHPLRGAVPELD